jgi:Zn-dependent protease
MDLDLTAGIMWYLVFLFSTSWHEASHAWVAHKLGDSTAYHGGQVTLDPTPHIRREPIGMVVVPLLSFVLGGWMIGWASAPYDPEWAREHPRRSALMALAGPGANLLIVILAAILMRVGFAFGAFDLSLNPSFMEIVSAAEPQGAILKFCAEMLSLFFSLNILLCVFNLLPVPPLDGSNIPFLYLPPEIAEKYRALLQQPALSLIGLFIAWELFSVIFYPIFNEVLKLFYALFP